MVAQFLKKKKKKFTSRTHENHQATLKTRYCGHLYSPLLRKWTRLDHRGWVSHCMERGLERDLKDMLLIQSTVLVGYPSTPSLLQFQWAFLRNNKVVDGAERRKGGRKTFLAFQVSGFDPDGLECHSLVKEKEVERGA